MKYRVTTRGWIVFSIIGILIIVLLINAISGFDNANNDKPIDEVNKNVDSEVIESSKDLETESDSDTEDSESNDTADDTTISDSDEQENDSDDEDNTSTENTTNNNEVVNEIDMTKTSDILFDKNVYDLTDSSKLVIDEWFTILEENQDLKIIIEGHINGYPLYDDGQFGMTLSLNRATIIAEYLIEKGIKKDNITIINMGSSDQIDMSDNIENHYLNRRSKIYFNKKP